MPDPNNPFEIQGGKLTKAAPDAEAPASLDEARRRRDELGAAPPAPDAGLIAAGPPAAPEQPAPQPEQPAVKALADQLVMFCSADGLRRFQMVDQPYLTPPEIVELECHGKQKVIALPGQDAVERRKYRYVRTVNIPPLGLMVHHFQEC